MLRPSPYFTVGLVYSVSGEHNSIQQEQDNILILYWDCSTHLNSMYKLGDFWLHLILFAFQSIGGPNTNYIHISICITIKKYLFFFPLSNYTPFSFALSQNPIKKLWETVVVIWQSMKNVKKFVW